MSTICMNPFTLSEDNGGHQVPCGKCYNCKRRRASSWSVRLMKEYERSTSGYFLTLTYDTKHVDITDKGFMTLNKKHLQDFFKRLRIHLDRYYDKKKIRVFYCGEYGAKGGRAHYHACIFGHVFNHDPCKDYFKRLPSGSIIYGSSELCNLWPFGHAAFGTLTYHSAGYTARYTLQKIEDTKKYYKGRYPPFCQASLKPAIGKEYFDQNYKRMFSDQGCTLNLKFGQPPVRVPIPYYYKKLLKEKDFDLYKSYVTKCESYATLHTLTPQVLESELINENKNFELLHRELDLDEQGDYEDYDPWAKFDALN